jgi:hypothetical protein
MYLIASFITFDPRERASANILIDSLNSEQLRSLRNKLLSNPSAGGSGPLLARTKSQAKHCLILHTLSCLPSDGLLVLDNFYGLRPALLRRHIRSLDPARRQLRPLCVQHDRHPSESQKFLGEVQSHPNPRADSKCVTRAVA